ncbi:helicase [Zophobihabitans entericus]|uniref:Helicase n=2 Tax=Zophobihabitans entericus TaxID=1635327 RepID=A0A6G9IDT3_9GAMM|nr:helicase [Zophobihabitans entericus]
MGVLYPAGCDAKTIDEQPDTPAPTDEKSFASDPENIFQDDNNKENIKESPFGTADDGYDLDLALTNVRLPQSFAISFSCNAEQLPALKIMISGGLYAPVKVKNYQWWYRTALNFTTEIQRQLWVNEKFTLDISAQIPSLPAGFKLSLKGYMRRNEGQKSLITLALINESKSSDPQTFAKDLVSLFQTELKIEATLPDGSGGILPYPEASTIDNDPEELCNQLLYRSEPIFAVGHGCSANWAANPWDKKTTVHTIWTDAMPTYEVPSITPDIEIIPGKPFPISMNDCANLTNDLSGPGYQRLTQLVEGYQNWINQQTAKLEQLQVSQPLKEQGRKNLQECHTACQRMREGLTLLSQDIMVRKAFTLMNQAMQLQQQHHPKHVRAASFDEGYIRYQQSATFSQQTSDWRAFQIGFILMSLASVVNGDSPEHETVELIWFPTGGGKTEAYLGLAAFDILYKRLRDKDQASGVQILMRYTLRLLTAQQLQRASTLICALEVLRRRYNIPGKPFSIGLWVGGSTTPNKGSEAIKALNKLKKEDDAPNPFLFDRCPWCSAQMGPMKIPGKPGKDKYQILGIHAQNQTVELYCPDQGCDFFEHLPVYLIDEDIYKNQPTIVIGTVDKFAMLAWNQNIRALFGLNEQGEREINPPSLIIQDELHLITGPLGSMVGLYEPLIEELCTDKRGSKPCLPKIICATATTRRYKEQIRHLYGREQANLFPPPAIDADDSFFAVYKRDKNTGELVPGRKYIGINAPGLGSQMSVQVRAFSALLDASNHLRLADRDAWRTLLVFYNSIRELGGGKTLFQSDIPERLRGLGHNRPENCLKRFIHNDTELTSRLKSDEVPQAIAKLQKGLPLPELKEIQQILSDIIPSLQDVDLKTRMLGWQAILATSNEVNALPLESYYDFYLCRKHLVELNIEPSQELTSFIQKIYGLGVVDVCIASNIIEVGIDIERLGLMAIVGQPKTTAQYIQISGRVGRSWRKRPGMIVTIYSASKPRDRSHYEHFRGYHQRLYAQVEPSSVTPWSLPAIERALAAVCVAYIRQTTPKNTQPGDTLTLSRFNEFIRILFDKRALSMGADMPVVKHFLDIKVKQWQDRMCSLRDWGRIGHPYQDGDVFYVLGTQVDKAVKLAEVWAAPTSMRSVDGESLFGISRGDLYTKEEHYHGKN